MGIYSGDIFANIQWLKAPSKSQVRNNPIKKAEQKMNLEGALSRDDERALGEENREAMQRSDSDRKSDANRKARIIGTGWDLLDFSFSFCFKNKRLGLGVEKHDIHIKSKSYKLELLGELVI